MNRISLFAATAAVFVVVLAGCTRGPGPDGMKPEDTAPSFTEMAANQTYAVGEAVSWMLPRATGGNGMLTYSLEGTVPGLQFDPGSRTLSGTPTTAGSYDMTYTVEDGDENTDAGDTATQSFTITVQEPEPPAIANYVGTWYFAVPVTTILVLGEDTFTLTVGDGSPIGETAPLNAVTRIAVEGTVAVSDITATTVTMKLGPETVTIEPAPQPPLVTEPFIITAAAGDVVASIDGDRMSVSGQVVAGIQLLLRLPLDMDLTACRDAPCVSS